MESCDPAFAGRQACRRKPLTRLIYFTNMEEIYKAYRSNPSHLFKPHSKYMVTAGTYLNRGYLQDPAAKEKLLQSIFKGCQKHNWKTEEWVILDNHYHLILEAPEDAASLPKLINEVHKFTALWIKKHLNIQANNHIFFNFWDSCLTHERFYYSRINYVYLNPVKHKYVLNAKDYLFGSYYYRFKEGKDELEKLRLKFPCDRVNVKDDF